MTAVLALVVVAYALGRAQGWHHGVRSSWTAGYRTAMMTGRRRR